VLAPLTASRNFAAALAGCLLVVLGAKLWLIGNFGSSTPFWDQWDAEGVFLYQRYLTGALTPSDLFAHHNEHRILFTRLSGLALLALNGQWDPLLQMIVNAAVHTLTLGAMVVVLGRELGPLRQVALAVFCMATYALPFSWENTLWGFQIQFYLLLLFGILSVALLCDAPAWSARWWLGTLFAIASYLNSASGALTLAAPIAVAAAQTILGRRRGARELAATALHAAMVAVMIADVPSLAHHSSMAARSVEQNFIALITAGGWPLISHDWMVRYRVLAVLLINAPLLLVALSALRDRPGVTDRRWCLLGLGAWVALQMIAISYGRATAVWASRYYDIFTFGLVVNGACALALMRIAPVRIATVARVAVALWFGTILLGLVQKARETLAAEVTRKDAESQIQAENVKSFLASGDFAHLRDKPPMHVPYPSAERLRDILSDPVIREILPPTLLGKEAPRRLDRAVRGYGPHLVPIGLALLLIAIAGIWRRRSDAAG
jgi:hypothetical protein